MIQIKQGPPIIFGEVLFDRFPDGSVVMGGAPFNVAWHLQALGLAPMFVSRVGADELGDRIITAMKDWGLDLAGIQRDQEHSTGTVEVSVEGGEPKFEIAADRAYDFISVEELPELPAAGILYHGSLALRTEPPRRALDHLRGSTSTAVLVDVNLRAPWWDRRSVMGLLRTADWVKLNEGELAKLVPEEPDIEARADRLLTRSDLEGLIVTRGADGAWVRGRDGWAHEPDPVVAEIVIDTVGAGDAFSSIVLFGLTRGWPWPEILSRAQRFAAAVVGLRGATTDDRGFYEPFIRSWEF
jgi:fructokinase